MPMYFQRSLNKVNELANIQSTLVLFQLIYRQGPQSTTLEYRYFTAWPVRCATHVHQLTVHVCTEKHVSLLHFVFIKIVKQTLNLYIPKIFVWPFSPCSDKL